MNKEQFFESLLNEKLFCTLSGGGRNMDLPEEDQFDYIDVGDLVESAYRTKAFPFGMRGVVTKLWPETKEITIKTVNGGHRKIKAYTVCEVKKSGEMSESIKFNTNQPMNETIDGKYAAACYRAERVLASFYKDFGKEMTRMAFEHELDDIDF